MIPNALTSTDLTELLRPREGGRLVNPHIVTPALDVMPDYEAMRRLLATPPPPTPVRAEPDRDQT